MCYIEVSKIEEVQMEEQIENHYGNITFNQLAHFVVSLCGYDALLSEKKLTKSEINDAYKEKGTYEKFRFTDKNSIFSKAWDFFTKLEDEFEIPKIELISSYSLDKEKNILKNISLSQHFYYHLIWWHINYIINVFPFEMSQNDLSKSILISYILDSKVPYQYIHIYKKINFKDIFEDFKNKHGKTYEEIYKLIADNSENKKADSVKRTLEQCRKENKNPPWKIFYPLLKIFHNIDKEYSEKLFNCYFYINFKSSLKHLAINENNWNTVEEIIDNDKNESQINSFIVNKIEFLIKEQSEIMDILNKLTKENIPSSLEKFKENKNEIKKKLPNLFPFFENWFLAKEFVFQFLEKANFSKLEKAVEWYLKALKTGKYFAGIFLIQFLTEAVSVSIYYDYKKNLVQARKRIQNNYSLSSDTKTALDKNSKVFFDFALAFDLFVNEKKDSAILYYHASENFWLKFPPTSEKSEKLCKDDSLKFTRIELDNEKDNFCKSKQFYENISDNKINHYISTKKDISYTPISRAICQKYYDIVELYLDEKEYPSLDVNIPATNNCYPVHEILTKCRQSGATEVFKHASIEDIDSQLKDLFLQISPHLPIGNIDLQLKNLFFKILERTNKKILSTETNRTKISILQTAIDTLDIEIVQAVLEEMLGKRKFPSNYRITADEMSPLYYAINKRNHLVNPEYFLENLEKNSENIKYGNSFVPGFTTDDKRNFRNQIHTLFPFLQEEITEKILDNIPKEEWDKSISKIDKIIDLLISKTENVDDFIFYPPAEKIVNNIGVNALLLTCEYNDTVTCKKLIEAGADLSKSIGKCLHPHPFSTDSYFFFPHNFIYRAIQFESWDCLELVLTEYKQKIKDTNMMHCSEGFPITPLVYFLIKDKSVNVPHSNQQYLLRFIPLFLDAGADLNEPTIYGSVNEILRG